MKKILLFLMSTIFIFSAAGCKTGGNTDNGNNDNNIKDQYDYVSMLTDKTFKNGFLIRGLGTPIYNDPIETFGPAIDPMVYFQYGKQGLPEPEWNLCQWATRYPFHDINNASLYLPEGKINYSFTKLSDGIYNYTNSSKTITVDTNTGEYTLGLKASECFKYPRIQGQEWPHWFIEKKIGNAGNPLPQTSIAQSQSIKVRFDVKVNKFEDKMEGQDNPLLHSGMCVFYLFVSNRNPSTKVFTDMLWFGLTVFDNRYVMASEQSFPDVGSKASASEKWIFNIAGSEFFTPDYNLKTPENEVILNEWKSVDIDVLQFIDKAFKAAKQNGYMKTSSWENLYINGMYFGYETPGTYDIDMSFKNVDILSYIKTN